MAEGAALRVTGGEFSGNFADNGGGAFFVEDSGDFDVSSGLGFNLHGAFHAYEDRSQAVSGPNWFCFDAEYGRVIFQQ